MSENYRKADACRLCHSADLAPVLDLGVQAINAFPEDPTAALDTAPLLVVRCGDCGLVQLAHTVQRERLFSEMYWYRSGTNETMVAALRDIATDALSKVQIGASDHILDVGCNDGTLMDLFQQLSRVPCLVLGVDPSPISANLANEDEAAVFHGYFPDVLGQGTPGHAKVITSIATFYASDDPHAYVAAIKRILHPEGIWVVQLQDHRSVVRDTAVDFFCHEHLVLWDEYTFQDLVRQHGLEIQDVSYNDVNGGSVRFTVGHGQRAYGFPFPRPDGSEWDAFKQRAETNRAAVRGFLRATPNVGGLAASTKANTYLQWAGIGPDLLPWIADRDPRKVGRTTVTGIPIVGEDAIEAAAPDVRLVALAWHFRDAFVKRYPGRTIVSFLPELNVHYDLTERVAA